MRLMVPYNNFKAVFVAFSMVLATMPVRADLFDQLIVNVAIDGGGCNDSAAEWKTWLEKTVQASCVLPVKNISVSQADVNLSNKSGKLSNGVLQIDLVITAPYEGKFRLCMGSLAASAVHKDSEGSVFTFPTYNVLGWNTNTSNLMGALEREMLSYIKNICNSANDSKI